MMTESLARVAAVADGTFREAVRDRLFALVGFFGLLLVAATTVLAPLTVGAQAKIVADVGLAGMALFGLLVVVLVGSNLVRKEIDRRTLVTVLTKPVARTEYLLGKYAGLALTVLVMLALMGLIYLGAVALTPATLSGTLASAMVLVFLELLVLTAAALTFSLLVSPALAAVFSLAFYAIGHLSTSLLAFGEMGGPGLRRTVCRAVFAVLPNLEFFNRRADVVHGDPVGLGYLGLAALYAGVYVMLFLLLARALFARKEL